MNHAQAARPQRRHSSIAADAEPSELCAGGGAGPFGGVRAGHRAPLELASATDAATARAAAAAAAAGDMLPAGEVVTAGMAGAMEMAGWTAAGMAEGATPTRCVGTAACKAWSGKREGI